MKLHTSDADGTVRLPAGSAEHKEAAKTVLLRTAGVLLLEIDLLKRRVEHLCSEVGPTDRHDRHQPEQVEAMHICNSLQRSFGEYPSCWDQAAAKRAGIEEPTQADLMAIRRITVKKITELWEAR